jgi:hypothetical protein
MRRILPIVFGCVLLAVPVLAQRGGHGGGGGGHGGGGGGHVGGGGMRGGGSAGFRGGSSAGGYRGAAAFRGGVGYRGGIVRSGGLRLNFGYRGGYGYGGYYGWPYYYPGFYAGYCDPFYSDCGYVDPYYNSYSSYGDAGYAYAPPAPDPPVVAQQPPAPAVREYPAPAQTPQAQKYGEPLYLLAMRDGTIRAVLSYWADGPAVHYVTMDHEQKQAPLSSVDRALSEKLNRERNVTFRLPG